MAGELMELVQEVTGEHVELASVDQGYTGDAAADATAEQGIRLVLVRLPGAMHGFVLLPRRWVVERSFAWLARFRRLARDCERLPELLVGIRYDAYGRKEGGTTGDPADYQYGGAWRYEREPDTTADLKLDYLYQRYYDRETGRFISRDPISYAGGVNPLRRRRRKSEDGIRVSVRFGRGYGPSSEAAGSPFWGCLCSYSAGRSSYCSFNRSWSRVKIMASPRTFCPSPKVRMGPLPAPIPSVSASSRKAVLLTGAGRVTIL